jgi:hypothetical protein
MPKQHIKQVKIHLKFLIPQRGSVLRGHKDKPFSRTNIKQVQAMVWRLLP